MSRTENGRVQLSISLDQAVVRRLQEQAATRSMPLADYVEELVQSATLGTRTPSGQIPGEKEPSDLRNGDVSEERLPRSVGLGDVEFDAHDTDAWLAAHWGQE